MPNSNEHNVLDIVMDFLKSANFFIGLLIIPAIKGIDKYFEYLKGKDRDFIKSVVKEGMNENMRELRDDINEIRKAQDRDREAFNDKIMQILRDGNKK